MRDAPSSETAAMRSGQSVETFDDSDAGGSEACSRGLQDPSTDTDHRGLLSQAEFPELFNALHEIEQFVRRNPWPMMALGFAAGYFLSRSKVR
jgi:hypothetical protein